MILTSLKEHMTHWRVRAQGSAGADGGEHVSLSRFEGSHATAGNDEAELAAHAEEERFLASRGFFAVHDAGATRHLLIIRPEPSSLANGRDRDPQLSLRGDSP